MHPPLLDTGIKRLRQGVAFSLIELLVVIGIVGILAALGIPAIQSIAGAYGVTRAGDDAAALLELARNEALARQTYVWVGFESTNNSGSMELLMAAVASRDGCGTNTAGTNLTPLTRVVRIKNTALASWENLKSDTRNLLPSPDPISLSTNSDGITFQVGATPFQSGRTLTFSPRGEVLLKGKAGIYDGYERLIALGLRQTRGTSIPQDADDLAVLVEGATGSTSLLQIR